MRAKCYDMDPIICEVNRLLEYVDTGRMRSAQNEKQEERNTKERH
jgi:hypothetical protein